MKITEKVIDNPEKERVVLEYVNFTKEFAEIKEYVQKKGEQPGIYSAERVYSCKNGRYFVFRDNGWQFFCIHNRRVLRDKNKLYQIEEKLTRKCQQRASKTMILNADHIVSVHTALNGRLYVRMENAEEILVTRKYAKEITGYLMETN